MQDVMFGSSDLPLSLIAILIAFSVIVAVIAICYAIKQEEERRRKSKEKPKLLGLTMTEMLDMERNNLLGQIHGELLWRSIDHFNFHHFHFH